MEGVDDIVPRSSHQKQRTVVHRTPGTGESQLPRERKWRLGTPQRLLQPVRSGHTSDSPRHLHPTTVEPHACLAWSSWREDAPKHLCSTRIERAASQVESRTATANSTALRARCARPGAKCVARDGAQSQEPFELEGGEGDDDVVTSRAGCHSFYVFFYPRRSSAAGAGWLRSPLRPSAAGRIAEHPCSTVRQTPATRSRLDLRCTRRCTSTCVRGPKIQKAEADCNLCSRDFHLP